MLVDDIDKTLVLDDEALAHQLYFKAEPMSFSPDWGIRVEDLIEFRAELMHKTKTETTVHDLKVFDCKQKVIENLRNKYNQQEIATSLESSFSLIYCIDQS